jgi:hypothetical protein
MRPSPFGRIAASSGTFSAYFWNSAYTSTSMPLSCAIACRCFTQLMEPDSASTTMAALAIESALMMSRGL